MIYSVDYTSFDDDYIVLTMTQPKRAITFRVTFHDDGSQSLRTCVTDDELNVHSDAIEVCKLWIALTSFFDTSAIHEQYFEAFANGPLTFEV